MERKGDGVMVRSWIWIFLLFLGPVLGRYVYSPSSQDVLLKPFSIAMQCYIFIAVSLSGIQKFEPRDS